MFSFVDNRIAAGYRSRAEMNIDRETFRVYYENGLLVLIKGITLT
jgi:hypothetical protein